MSYQTEIEEMEIMGNDDYSDGYDRALQDVLPVIERAVAAERERKGWKAYAVVDAKADNYLYKGFFLNRKDAEKSWKNDLSGTKGLVIIELDVYPALTPLPDKE